MSEDASQTRRRELAALFLLAALALPLVLALAWGRLGVSPDSSGARPGPNSALAPAPSQAPPLALEAADREYLMGLLLDSLQALKESREPPETTDAPAACGRKVDMSVVASLYLPGRRHVREIARRATLVESTRVVAQRLAENAAYRERGFHRADRLRVRFDVITRQQDLPPEQREQLAMVGLGEPLSLALWTGDKAHLFLPGDMADYRAQDHLEAFRALCEQAGLSPETWREKKCPVSALRTLSFVNTTGGSAYCFETVRGLPLAGPPGVPQASRSCRLAARYLQLVQDQESGTFAGSHDAATGLSRPGDDVRLQAEAAAALARLCKWQPNESRLEACRKALWWLVHRAYVPKGRSDIAYVRPLNEAEPPSLQDAAAALAAFCEYRSASQDETWDALATRLGTLVLSMQDEDGRFAAACDPGTGAAVRADTSPRDVANQCDAARALAIAYQELGEPRFLLGARKALDLLNSDEQGLRTPPAARRFVVAVRQLALSLPPDAYMPRVRSAVDLLRRDQLCAEEAPAPDMVGGALRGYPPAVGETAADLEAFVSGWLLAGACSGEDAEALLEHSKSAALLAARYVLQFQFYPENSYYLADPEAAEGGFRSRPGSNAITLRCVQLGIDAMSLLTQALLVESQQD